MNILSKLSSALVVAIACGLPAVAMGAPAPDNAPLPIEAFFTSSEFAGAILSPNGRFLAAKAGKGQARLKLAVIDLENNSVKIVAGYSDIDIQNVYWINDQRLVYTTTDRRVGQGDARLGPGLYAVNRDGTGQRQLIDNVWSKMSGDGATRMLPAGYNLLPSFGRHNSDSVYVTRRFYRGTGIDSELDRVNLYKLDTITGQSRSLDRPSNSTGFVMDHAGEPRLAATKVENMQAYHFRDPATGAWRELVRFDAYKMGPNTWTPAGFAPDGTLYAVGRRTEDKESLYRVNLSTGQLDGAPIVALEDFDFRGGLIFDDKGLLGIEYRSDAPATIWLDADLKRIQGEIDAVLKTTVNTIQRPLRAETPYILVNSQSDIQPPVVFLYDSSKKTFSKVGESRPAIKAEKMASQEFVKVKARDGMTVPAWLTIPNGSNRKNLPMFVLVHGGPWVDGTQWGWNGPNQFLASRGYAVLEPDFRGTLGYGDKHYRSSFKQWGLAMQDDVADTVRWAIKEGIADPKRICIGGASYGGYATLMGLVNDPDLFKCGVNWVGVTDINLMYSDTWSQTSDMGESWKKYGMPEMIGDRVKDAEQLKKTSPIEQAARITQPLLMAYGAADNRVPIFHGEKFTEAVKKTNSNVEMIVYPEEGHGWVLRKNQLDWWNRVEKFLNQHIGSTK